MGTAMGTSGDGFSTLREVLSFLGECPEGTTLRASAVREILEDLPREEPEPAEDEGAELELTWRERLWLVPAETRIGTTELAEGLDRPKSFIYARTRSDADDPIPHRKLDGTLTFVVGEVRAWLREREEVLAAGPKESTPGERRLSLIEGEEAR